MSDSSSNSSSEQEACKPKGKGNKQTKKDESPDKESNQLFTCVDITEKELKYRQKNFKDDKKVVSTNRIYCTACGTDLKHFVYDGREVFNHPVLKVLMCKSCVKFYGDGSFSPDEDGSDRFCRWCAQGGTLYCCSGCSCVFCKKCIKRNLKRSVLDDIEEEDWKCFVCDVKPLWELRAICSAAQTCANEIRRNKKKEIAENLKELQKRLPEKTQNRRCNRWQRASKADVETVSEKQKRKRHRSTSSESEPDSADHKDKRQKGKRRNEDLNQPDSSGGEAEQNKLKPNQTKKQFEKKRNLKESNSDDSSKASKLRKKDITNHLQKQNKEKSKDEKLEQSSIKGNVSDRSKPKTPLKNVSSANEENTSLPEMTDKDTAQWFCHWLKDLGQDIIDQSNLCSNNVTKVLEKRVVVKKMMNTKTAEKTVEVLQALIELTSENLERAKGLLSLNHKYWKSRVIKLNKELHDDDDDDDDDDDGGDNEDDSASDDKPLKIEKTVPETRTLRQRKQVVRNSSEVSSNESEEESTVIKKKSKSKKTGSVAEDAGQTVVSKQNLSDSDETLLSGADNKINRKQKALKKESASKLQNKNMENSSSEDHLCNGIKEVPQNDSAASSSEECTVNEGLATKLDNENLENVSQKSKKKLEENKRTAKNQEDSNNENTEEEEKCLENGRNSSSKKGNENVENAETADEIMNTSNEEEKQDESTMNEAEEEKQDETTKNEAAAVSAEDQSNMSVDNVEEFSAAEENELMDTDDFFNASTDVTQEYNTENDKKSTNTDKSSSSKENKQSEENKQSKESDKEGSDNECKGKNSEEVNDNDLSMSSTETLQFLCNSEPETDSKDVKKDTNSQTTENENTDVECSLKSSNLDKKDEPLLAKVDLSEIINEKEGLLKDEDDSKNKNETDQNDSLEVAENEKVDTTAGNIQEESLEEETKYTEGGCKAQQSLLGYSSDDENDREETEENSESKITKRKKHKKGKSAGITSTSTPLKETSVTKAKRSKKQDDLLPSDIDSDDSEDDENLGTRAAKLKIKSKDEDKQKSEATKEEEEHSSDKEGAKKKQTKDKDIKRFCSSQKEKL